MRASYEAESTVVLASRAREGDSMALEVLAARLLPRLRRWASGRLPRWARDLSDTTDIVQETLVNVLGRLEEFEPRHELALTVYLRQSLSNRIRNELRRVSRRPATHGLEIVDAHASDEPSPLAQAVTRESIERYEGCLARLTPKEREAVVGRLELQYSYKELADAWGRISPDAARKTVERAVGRLVTLMSGDA